MALYDKDFARLSGKGSAHMQGQAAGLYLAVVIV